MERGRRNDGAIFQFRPHLETLALLLPRQKGIVFPLLSLLELQEDKHGAQREEDVTPATANNAHWGRERGRRVQGKKRIQWLPTTERASSQGRGAFSPAHCFFSALEGEGQSGGLLTVGRTRWEREKRGRGL